MPSIVKELTPPHLRCIPCSCPAVYQLDNGDLLIIGKQVDARLLGELSVKVGHDEIAVTVKAEMLANLPGNGGRRLVQRY